LLVTTALSLTCIWAWSNFYSTLQSTFISKWAQHYPSNDVVLVWHLFFTAVSWLFMSALYYNQLDRLRVARRNREEFNQQHPIEMVQLGGIITELEQLAASNLEVDVIRDRSVWV
ncbi:unnamed protein product, partial [Polarella glacialis]